MSGQNLTKNKQSLAQENSALRNEISILKEQLALLQEQLGWLKKQVFGRKTEQTSVIMDDGTQLSLFPAEMEQAVSVTEKTITVPEHQRKAKRTHDEWMSNLPVKEVWHEEDNPVCEKCSAEMKEIGEEKVYDELVYVPGAFYVRRHIAKKYKCKSLFSISPHTSFRQILPIAALKKLTIRQYAFAFSPCSRQNYARKSAHVEILNRL